MSNVIICGLDSGPVWGVPDSSYGKGQSFENNQTSEVGELKDGAGRTVAYAIYDSKRELNYTVKITGEASGLAIGKKVTVTDPASSEVTNAHITGIKLVMSNTDFAEYQLTMVAYDNASDTSYSQSDLSISI